MLWGSSSQCQTPRLGNLVWGSELSFLWENFCGIIILQFVGHPPRLYGIWLYCECTPPTISLWLLLYVFECRMFSFGSFQSFLLMVVQQLVVILVCLWEEVSSRSFYSIMLSPILLLFACFLIQPPSFSVLECLTQLNLITITTNTIWFLFGWFVNFPFSLFSGHLLLIKYFKIFHLILSVNFIYIYIYYYWPQRLQHTSLAYYSLIKLLIYHARTLQHFISFTHSLFFL